MKLQLVGCSHHNATVELRERLAFSPDQAKDARALFRSRFPDAEAVLLSTCNRVELYTAAVDPQFGPSHHDVVEFIAEFHGLNAAEIFDDLFERTGEDAVRHLFTVSASLDSMVVGEAQILSQVKQAYNVATSEGSAGTLCHSLFQAGLRVAKRVANETAINEKRVSIPSVAVAEFATQIFERFDDKEILVLGAGEMAEETLRYLVDEGGKQITILNRNRSRAAALAAQMGGKTDDWANLEACLSRADIVVSTTGATEAIVTAEQYKRIEQRRHQRKLFVLDLAVPRDFDPAVGDATGVYLYSIDDLMAVCEENRAAREKEWPAAERIIEEETAKFMKELYHRATGPTIQRLKDRANEIRDEEVRRLLNKLGDVDERTQNEIVRSFDRLVNKILYPPLESLRDEAASGTPHGLLDALKKLFRLVD